MRVEMNAAWVTAALVVPLLLGLLVAYPLWLAGTRDEIGSIAGSAIVLVCAVTCIAREYGEVLATTARCIEANIGCRFRPEPFVRYSIYGGIAMSQVFVLFFTGLSLEERLREPHRD